MDEIIKFLKSMGLGDQEIQKVLRETPVEKTGLMGTNVATGVFLKGGKKEMSELPLIVEKITNPFEVNFYKGRSKEETIKSAEAGIKYLDEELKKTADLILNKNAQLTQEQKINFAKNLEVKRKFEKDLEDFKTKPETPVIELKTKEPVIGKGLESLIEEAGQTSRPGTLMGDIESRINRLKNLTKEEGTTMQDVVADFASGQKGMLKLRDEGLVRSTVRQIMFNDIKSGKLKASKEVQDIVSGKASGDPIDSFRTIYGEDALEQLDSLTPDLRQLKTEVDAEKLARSKFEFTPKLDRPKESYTPEEMEKIISLNNPSKTYKPFGSDFTRQEKVDWLIKNVDQEAEVTIPSPEFLQNMLDSGREDLIDHFWEIHTRNIGSKPVIDIDTSNLKNPALVRAMMEDRAKKPKLVSSKEKVVEDSVDDAGKVNKDDPEKFAKGGSVESKGLDYLMGIERSSFEKGTIPRMLKFLIDKLADEKDFNRKLLERANPKAVQDLYIEKYGKLPSAEELKEIVNKELQGKYSMETANPKTGEVTTPKEPVTTAGEKYYFYDTEEEFTKVMNKHKRAAKAHDELPSIDIYDKIAPDQLGEVMAEMAGKNVDKLTDAQRREYYKKAQTYLSEFIKVNRTRIAVDKFNEGLELTATDRNYLKFAQPETKSTYKQGDIITSENFGDTPFAPDLSGLEQARKMTKEMSLEEEMNMVLNRYDKSMFIKNEQGMVDVTNPENVQKMALLLKQDHPDIYKRLQEGSQIDELENFDITGRKPNATGGRVGYAEGSDEMEPSSIYEKKQEYVPSITLDSHDKAPANMDKYPIKAGNLELGIMSAMSSGKSTPNPYVKINTADRNFTVRGKYNVPDTGISLLGDIGDVRSRSKVGIDVPEFNYKESFKDVMRANPYSVGIEYAPDQNKNINLRYDDRGNVTLRGEARFAKGGLGYLMGE